MNKKEEQEKLLRILQNSHSGLEEKTTTERICGQVTQEDNELIRIDKNSHMTENGGIREVNIFNIRTYACGCRVDGRANFGGVDYKGNFVCSKHFYRCIRCRKALSILTVKPIRGYCYCRRCARIVKFLRFIGLKK